MVKSQTTSITPTQHAANHAAGGSDPLVAPLIDHTSQHISGGSDPVPSVTVHLDATGARVAGTTYQNTHDRPMHIVVGIVNVANTIYNALSDAATPPTVEVGEIRTGNGGRGTLAFWVMANHYYKVTGTFTSWHEWY